MADDTKPNETSLALLNAKMDSLAREVGALDRDDPKRADLVKEIFRLSKLAAGYDMAPCDLLVLGTVFDGRFFRFGGGLQCCGHLFVLAGDFREFADMPAMFAVDFNLDRVVSLGKRIAGIVFAVPIERIFARFAGGASDGTE